MPARKIMIIRHAEKPSDDGSIAGVTAAGAQDPEELIVQGWQRAGALGRFFAPFSGPLRDPGLAVPGAIFASGVAKHAKSRRPQHTVLEVSALLGIALDTNFTKGDEVDLAATLKTLDGVTLVAWQHEDIPAIVNAITGNATTCPQKWPGERFDLVWVLDQPDPSAAWSFSQVPQMLLSGDSTDPIPF